MNDAMDKVVNLNEPIKRRKSIIIYHNDLDGKCSAAIAARVIEKYNSEIYFIPSSYEEHIQLPIDPWEYETIYILDYSLKEMELRTIRSLWKDKNIIWIDHHISEKEMWEKYSMIPGYRVDGIAACKLTWRWFHDMYPMPRFVEMIGDRDLWKFNFYGDDTIWFIEYFDTIFNEPKSAIWKPLFDQYIIGEDSFVDEFIEKGKLLRSIKLRRLNDLIDEISYESEIDGYKCLEINFSNKQETSDICHLMLSRGYNVVIVYRIKKKDNTTIVNYRITSKDPIDCSVIAKKRGGGGHKLAAGWVEII